MNTMQAEYDAEIDTDESERANYRALSKAAVATLVFAILGLLSLWASVFTILPIIGICFGLIAISNLKRYPAELVGHAPARVGLVANIVLSVLAIGMHAYIYATEVPDGYERISFYELKPRGRQSPLPYSPRAEEVDGKKVFLKGYVRPGDKRTNLKKFILVGDFGQCCFGGSPKTTDIVAIDIIVDETVNHSYGVRKIGGTFRLNRQPVSVGEKDIPGVYYQIEADLVN